MREEAGDEIRWLRIVVGDSQLPRRCNPRIDASIPVVAAIADIDTAMHPPLFPVCSLPSNAVVATRRMSSAVAAVDCAMPAHNVDNAAVQAAAAAEVRRCGVVTGESCTA